jgi:hypothetical protein
MRINIDPASGEEFPLFGPSHGSTLKLALICLLLGGWVCLAVFRVEFGRAAGFSAPLTSQQAGQAFSPDRLFEAS